MTIQPDEEEIIDLMIDVMTEIGALEIRLRICARASNLWLIASFMRGV